MFKNRLETTEIRESVSKRSISEIYTPKKTTNGKHLIKRISIEKRLKMFYPLIIRSPYWLPNLLVMNHFNMMFIMFVHISDIPNCLNNA